MFTGIVEELGTVESVERGDAGLRLKVAAGLSSGLRAGDSVAVSGACLTVAKCDERSFEADVMPQTARVTTLGEREVGDRVNLETPVRAGDPLGGHIVQGHVDCVGEVGSVDEDGFARRLGVSVPDVQQRYLIERGSVTVDGVSLTVAALTPAGFEVSLIPETLERTTLGRVAPGATNVNVELDVLARHVERLLRFKEEGST